MRLLPLCAIGLALCAAPVLAQDCGPPDTPCTVDGRHYVVALPAESGTPPPIFLFLHGYASSGAGALKMTGIVTTVTGRGYALVAPDGQPVPGDPKAPRDWAVTDGHSETVLDDDVAFIGHVLDDAAARFGLDRSRVLATGFSRGGSMIWDLACAAPGSATAFAAVSGAFWEPMRDCAGGVHLHHSHGLSDRVVPFEGRDAVFGGVAYVMGDVMASFDRLGAAAGCPRRASGNDTGGEIWVKRWDGCDSGSLTLALGPGGHGIPRGWSARVLDWFESLPAD